MSLAPGTRIGYYEILASIGAGGMDFPPTGRKWRISDEGGTNARWQADQKELFYLAPDRTLMAVSVSRDGERFLIATDVGGPTASPIILVLKWTAMLER